MKCDVCGKNAYDGMTDEMGSFHVHEGKCFKKYMNKLYGKHRWMMLGGEATDVYGGYYIVSADGPNGYEGTGIFYTTFEDDS